MKYSIIISPKSENSIAIRQAYHLINALLLNSTTKQPHEINVFFYGLAVTSAFDEQSNWQSIFQQGVKLTACSTIAESFTASQLSPYFSIAGLGHWMESVVDADRNIELI